MPSAERLMETPESRFVGLFIGRSGGGKSTAAYSFPKPMLVLDLDGRIRGGLSNQWIDPKGIEYEYYPPRGKEATYIKLNKDLEMVMMRQSGMQGFVPLKTLILDSITHETINLLQDAIPLTHDKGKGRYIGSLPMAGPDAYGFQAQATYSVMSFLKSVSVPNIIVTAHIVAKWGKAPDAGDYDPNIIVGEQLSLTDKMAENIPSYFDHIFRFSKTENGQRMQYFAKFQGELERTAYMGLPREEDITGKDFYKWMMEKVKREEPKTNVAA